MARDFLGHPRGLAVLFATETWERFSYFGNAALVVLYMVKYLLDPGRVETVLGFGAVKAALEFVFGQLDPQPLASQLFGFYTGFAYFTPDPGRAHRRPPARSASHRHHRRRADGDRPFHDGVRGAVPAGAAGADPRHRRVQAQHLGPGRRPLCRRGIAGATAPTRSSMSASISGHSLAPLVCGTLAVQFGWHYGFGAAGIGMLVSLGIYLYGTRDLPADDCRGPGWPPARRRRSTAASAAPCSRWSESARW